MALENLKRWHWAGIGVLTGAAIGFAWVQLHPPDAGASRSMRQSQFEKYLLAKADGEFAVVRDSSSGHGLPFLRRLVVYPPDAKGRVFVTGEALNKLLPVRPDPNDVDRVLPAEAHYGKFFFQAPQPYVPLHGWAKSAATQPSPGAAASSTPPLDVTAFLARVRADHPDAAPDFTYAWWFQPGRMTAGGALVGLLLLGGVWPTVVSLLIGAGLAPAPKEPKYDLSRFRSEPAPEKPAEPVGLSAGSYWEDQDDPERKSPPDPAAATQETPEPAAKPLETKPLEQPAVAQASPEDVEYAGEYYPVAHPKAPPTRSDGSDQDD